MTGAVVPEAALGLGPWEIALIVIVVILLFGAKKLPDLARGSGRALRIFKAETKGLLGDDDDQLKTDAERDLEEHHRERAERLAQKQAHKQDQQQAQDAPRPQAHREASPETQSGAARDTDV